AHPSLEDILKYHINPNRCTKGRVTRTMVYAPYIKRDRWSYESNILACLHMEEMEEAFLADQHFSMAPFPPAWATGPRKGRCPPSMYIGHIERPDPWEGQLCHDGTLTGSMFWGPVTRYIFSDGSMGRIMFQIRAARPCRKGTKLHSMLRRASLERPDPWCENLCSDGTMCGSLFDVPHTTLPTPTKTSDLPTPAKTRMVTPPQGSGIGINH
ncbi:hypothetical protein KIPB_003122, partial [Kipferlia bialata]